LNECPEELLVHMVGTCWSCTRPMVAKRIPMELYTGKLDTWFARKASNGQCGTCYQRTLYTKQPKKVARRKRQRPGSLTPEQLRRDRVAVGACLECGWTADDNAEPHAARYCDLYKAQVMEGINGCMAS
jgi:hypothetical protein